MLKVLIPILILLAGVFAAKYFASLRTAPSKTPTTESTAPFVQTLSVTPTEYTVELRGFGTVNAVRQYKMIPQVSGMIIRQAKNLQLGSFLKKGALLLKIDPHEFLYRVEQERANLAKADFELKEEGGKHILAKKEWSLADRKTQLNSITKSLALREPHLKAKKSALEAAKNSLKLAQLDVQRTVLRAPCDGVILAEDIAVGQLINNTTEVAEFACIDAFQVVVLLPQDQIQWLLPLDEVLPKARAQVQGLDAKVIRLLPNVDTETKMAKILLEIEQPTQQAMPLLLSTFVEASIQAKTLQHVYRIPNKILRKNDTLWIIDHGALKLIKLDIIARQTRDSLVRLTAEQPQATPIHIVSSYIPSPYEGMAVTTQDMNIAHE